MERCKGCAQHSLLLAEIQFAQRLSSGADAFVGEGYS